MTAAPHLTARAVADAPRPDPLPTTEARLPMTDTPTVGDELLNEIERVSAKRERWRQHAAEMPMLSASVAPAIMMMTACIEAGKRAIADHDAIACIAALKNLKDYSDDD